MTEQIYGWMENLAYYFIFLSAVMNFVPDNSYRKYIRYFMGILLIMLLLSPILQYFRLDEEIELSFFNYTMEEEATEQWENYARDVEEKYGTGTNQEEEMTE